MSIFRRLEEGEGQEIARLTFEISVVPFEPYAERRPRFAPELPEDLDQALLDFTGEHLSELADELRAAAKRIFGERAYISLGFHPGSVIIEVAVGIYVGMKVMHAIKTQVETIQWFRELASSIVRRIFRRFEREARVPFPFVVSVEETVLPAAGVLNTITESQTQSTPAPVLLWYLIVSHAAILVVLLALVISKTF